MDRAMSPELTKEEKNAFTRQWVEETEAELLTRDAPYYVPKQWRVKRDVRDGKRGVVAGIAWAENGRSIAAVEAVVKWSGTNATDDKGRDLFELAVAEVGDDEEFAAFLDQIGASYERGWHAGVRAVFDKWMEK
jgi:hypothetical protein